MGYTRDKRPLSIRDGSRLYGPKILLSSTPSTALEPRGHIAFQTSATSSETPPVWTLLAPEPGDQLSLVAVTIPSSSVAPIHVNSVAGWCFSSGGTAQDMATLSTNGAGLTAVARTSSEWMVTAIRGATFSTST